MIADPPASKPPMTSLPPNAAESRQIAATAKQPLYDVVIPLLIASRHETDELARVLTRAAQPPIIAVMCEPVPRDGTRWTLTVSIGVRAPSNLTAVTRAGKYVRRACRSLGFEPHMASQGITVGPSRL